MRNGPRRDLTSHDDFRFQALSVGIGIGDLRPLGGQRLASGAPGHDVRAQSNGDGRSHRDGHTNGDGRSHRDGHFDLDRQHAIVNKAQGVATMQPMTMQATEAPRVQAQPRPSLGLNWSRRFLAYGLDFFFVALTLAVALALATLLSAVRTGETENWLATKPIQWLAGLNLYAIVGGVYGAFFAYALLFKALAGNTVGEGLLGVSRKKSLKPVKT